MRLRSHKGVGNDGSCFVLIWTASLANLAGSDIIAVSSVFFLYLWTCIYFFFIFDSPLNTLFLVPSTSQITFLQPCRD